MKSDETARAELESLAIRCQLGELDAWESLVGHWQPRLWNFVVNMLGDRQRSEDVLQEIWARVVRSLIRLKDAGRLEAWMFTVARRAIADELRAEYRRPPTCELVELPRTDNALEAIAITDQLESELSRLHPADREVVVLHYLHELPLSEVAQMCSIPVGTAKSRLFRARKTIQSSNQGEKKACHEAS